MKEKEQAQKDYLDAITKAHELKAAMNKLSQEDKERFIKELLGTVISSDSLTAFSSKFKGGGN